MSDQIKEWFFKVQLRLHAAIALLLSLSVFFSEPLQAEASINPDQKQQVMVQLSKLPMQFESNLGQSDASVNYLCRGHHYSIFFTPNEIVMLFKGDALKDKNLSGSVLKLHFVGANSDPVIKGLEEQENKNHYFIGNDPEKWYTDIPLFAKVVYKNLYQGIDAVFYGCQGKLEYDFRLESGSDPHEIRLRIEGAKELLINTNGDLCIVPTDGQEIYMQKPYIYQEINGEQVPVAGQFILLASGEVGFQVEAYDRDIVV